MVSGVVGSDRRGQRQSGRPKRGGEGVQNAPDVAACIRARSRIFASGAKKQRICGKSGTCRAASPRACTLEPAGRRTGAGGPSSSAVSWQRVVFRGRGGRRSAARAISGRGTAAGRRPCDVQRSRKCLFCGEGLGIGRSDCGPYRRCWAVGFGRRGGKGVGQARRRREGPRQGPGKPARRGGEGERGKGQGPGRSPGHVCGGRRVGRARRPDL